MLALAALSLALDACSAGSPRTPDIAGAAPASPGRVSALPGPVVVDGGTARRLVAQGVKVVDVRTPEEFAAGHVPGAVNIPFDQVGARHAEIGPPSAPVLLYCHSGRRSGVAARALAERGFSAVYDMRSFDAWAASSPAAGRAGK